MFCFYELHFELMGLFDGDLPKHNCFLHPKLGKVLPWQYNKIEV